MTDRIPVLDNGYVQLIEAWGSDQLIIESARMSTDKGFLGWGDARKCHRCGGTGRQLENPDMSECQEDGCVKGIIGKTGDEKLLRYLWEHKHSTPFEFGGMTIEIKAPVFVFREWHRHRTQSYSEMSARYVPLPDENYIPSVERCLQVSSTNKQAGAASGAAALTPSQVRMWLGRLQDAYSLAETVYQAGLAAGIPKEVARLPVPVARYSKMRASANLRNWLAFLTLRMDGAAQWEIREYSKVVHRILSLRFPRTLTLFDGAVIAK